MLKRLKRLYLKLRYFLYRKRIKYGKDYFGIAPYPALTPTGLKVEIYAHALRLSDVLGVTVRVNPKVFNSLMKQLRKYGTPYCPCRFEKSRDTICPCKWHVKELIKYGRCRCGLFYIDSEPHQPTLVPYAGTRRA